jgi:hypothetical protein
MTGTLHEDQYTVVIVSRSVLRMTDISSQCFRENRNILCLVPFLENATVSEIIWKNVVEPDKATDDNMAHADCMVGY